MKTKTYLAIFLIAAVPGCYTVLQHPDVPNQDVKGNVYHQNIYAGDDCYSCHTEKEDQTYDYDKYVNYYSNSNRNEYNTSSRWDSYYSVPWWFSAPRVTVEAGKSTNTNTGTTTNKTTSGSTSTTRTSGSTRGNDVKITAPAATRSGSTTTSGSNSSSTSSSSSSSGSRQETKSSTNNSNDNNQGNSSSRSGSSSSNDEKRNSGSTRGK